MLRIFICPPLQKKIFMLEHQKKVIRNVSDNKMLFTKELIKSKLWLNTDEQLEMEQWLIVNYGKTHQYEIEKVFRIN